MMMMTVMMMRMKMIMVGINVLTLLHSQKGFCCSECNRVRTCYFISFLTVF